MLINTGKRTAVPFYGNHVNANITQIFAVIEPIAAIMYP